MFCPKCGSLLVPKNGKVGCSCGYTQEDTITVTLEHKQEDSKIEVVEKAPEVNPKIAETCPKCGNGEAFYGTQQTGPSDEPETIIYRCTKCGHTWRSANSWY